MLAIAAASDYNDHSPEILESCSMACPYFMPVARLENGSWPHPARLPLGAGWCGHCTAPGHEGEAPPQDVLEAFCNLGYASSCSWSPPERLWDSVRFAISARMIRPRVRARELLAPSQVAYSFLNTSARRITARFDTGTWNLIYRVQPGCGGTTMRAFSGWRSVFSTHI